MEYAGDPMTVQEQRAYVEARWERVSVGDNRLCTEGPTEYFVSLPTYYTPVLPTEDEAIAAAYAFTVAREREIAEREEEIGFVTYYLEETEHAVWKRLRDRLTAILEERKRGWKS